MTAFN